MEITINKVEEKTAKTGKKYVVVQTEQGKMACWNPMIFKDLIAGKKLDCTIKEEKGFKNILGIEKDLGTIAVKEYVDNKAQLMELSYAKDILVALVSKSGGEPLEMAKLSAQMLKEIKKELS